MYLRILGKDLKRKKSMNIILLVFIILAATFIASSMNNLIVITSAMDNYFKKAGISDYMILTIKEDQINRDMEDFLNHNSNVESWTKDEMMYAAREDFERDGEKEISLTNTALISRYHIKQQKFFDKDNKEITQMKDGEIYLPMKVMEDNKLKAGDKITLTNGDVSIVFTIQGNCKDAFMGSTMMGAARMIINDHDYNKLSSGGKLSYGDVYSVKAGNLKALEQDFNKTGLNVLVACDQNLISVSYTMDMMIAGMLLVVSICLILISFVILRFTIMFTLNEEFREIGIMKAIGIKSRKIRGLYITKYLGISLGGAFVGFILSIPFGNIFLRKVSGNVILSGEGKALFINLLCSLLIVGVVILFCYFCTRQVNKYSPIDAIRSGASGERFKRKGILHLNSSRLPAVLFLALNDILSSLKRYSSLIITFTLGIILIIVPINTINTLKSDNLASLFDMVKSDVYILNENALLDIRSNGRDYVRDYLNGIKEELSKKGIPAKVYCETLFKNRITYKDLSITSMGEQGNGTTTDQYTYMKGQAPRYADEVALTHITADKIGAQIGDTIQIMVGDQEKHYVITAIYQTMNNMGEGFRFNEKAELDYSKAIGIKGIQIKYTDHPSVKDQEKRLQTIVKRYPNYEVLNGRQYISRTIGNIADRLEGIKQLIVVVIILINMLVAVLMEKTFLTRETGEIGMLKSVGFNNNAIVQWQSLRMGLILLISTVLGAVLSNPIAQVSAARGFTMMGASHIDFVIKPVEVYIIYPLIIFAATMTASILTSLQVRRITVQQTNNIE